MATRRTQPYRAGGSRAQTGALLNMLRGRTTAGFNPKDVERGVAKMATARKAHGRPLRAARPPRPPR